MKTPTFKIASYTFTAANEADIPALEQLVNCAYRGEVSKKGWTTEADLLGGARVTAVSLLKDITNDTACIYTCGNGHGEMDACVFLQKNWINYM
jgi:hypothetical protein